MAELALLFIGPDLAPPTGQRPLEVDWPLPDNEASLPDTKESLLDDEASLLDDEASLPDTKESLLDDEASLADTEASLLDDGPCATDRLRLSTLDEAELVLNLFLEGGSRSFLLVSLALVLLKRFDFIRRSRSI